MQIRNLQIKRVNELYVMGLKGRVVEGEETPKLQGGFWSVNVMGRSQFGGR